MKKLTRMLAVMLLAVTMCIGLVSAASAETHGNIPYDQIRAGMTLEVACPSGIRLRAMPNGNGKIILTIPKGGHVYVMNKVAAYQGWILVTYGDRTGYTYTSDSDGPFYNDSEKTDIIEYPLTDYQATVKTNTSSLNVRSGPYITTQQIGYLTSGQVVDATANVSNGWVKVSYYSGSRQINGYVSGNYVTVKKKEQQIIVDPINEETAFTGLVGCVATSNDEADLKVYASPKTTSVVAEVLDESDMVYVVAKSNNGYWLQVNYYGSQDDDDDDDLSDSIGSANLLKTGFVLSSDAYVYKVFDKLKLSKTKGTVKVGKKAKLKVVDRYHFFSDVRALGVTVKYKSSDRSVAKVSKNGYVKGIKKGKAVITVTLSVGGGIYKKTRKLTCTVTVK